MKPESKEKEKIAKIFYSLPYEEKNGKEERRELKRRKLKVEKNKETKKRIRSKKKRKKTKRLSCFFISYSFFKGKSRSFKCKQ